MNMGEVVQLVHSSCSFLGLMEVQELVAMVLKDKHRMRVVLYLQ